MAFLAMNNQNSRGTPSDHVEGALLL